LVFISLLQASTSVKWFSKARRLGVSLLIVLEAFCPPLEGDDEKTAA
jgi:hypothetical protein